MLTQTVAIFVDAYRELNARKLFWATLILSGLVVVAFALIGINEKGLRVGAWTLEVPELSTAVLSRDLFYKSMFVSLGISFWLAWIATILALISTASIFPDFVSGGSVDLSLAQPIGRLRLFLTKYVAGLLFVTLQVSVFSLASFLLIGIMGGAWEPAIFLAIPIVTLFFSYLYCVCVLLGIMTRSTIAALMLTILLWFFIFLVNTGESSVLMFKLGFEKHHKTLSAEVQRLEEAAANAKSEEQAEADEQQAQDSALQELKKNIKSSETTKGRLGTAHSILMGFKTVLPKTAETVGLLERWLIDMAELPETSSNSSQNTNGPSIDDPEVQRQFADEIRSRSVWWILGTSVVFELVILSLAAWVFMRRDF